MLLLSLFFLFFVPQALAANDGFEYRHLFSPKEITIGDRISYIVTVEHDPGLTVVFALPDSTRLLPFVSIRQETKRLREQTTVLEAELALFDIGEHALPPVTVTLRDTSGGEKTMQVAPAGAVKVNALTDSSVTELLPIKPVKRPYRPWTDYLFPVFSGVMIITGIILIGYFVRKRTRSPSEPVDPEKDALRKIRKLEKSLEKGMLPEECYERLSYLIREYLEGEYHIRALEGVTNEIKDELSGCSVPHADTLIGLLDQADLVKFAESRPGREDCRVSLDQARKALKG